MNETHARSMTKSILWRIMGVLVLALVTYYYTRSLIQTTLITFLHHFSFIFIYYFHERAWLRNTSITGNKRVILRVFTYEIILGHCVLGLISLLILGSWTNVTWITITYIENKIWMYYVYDWIWSKTKWQTVKLSVA